MIDKNRRRDLTVGLRHKDMGLTVYARNSNRRDRHETRLALSNLCPRPGATVKILIIEDDRNVRLTLGRLVRHMLGDIELKMAETSHEAIDHLKTSVLEGQFNLVISDFDLLGGTTGAEVLEWVREHVPHLEARFLFLSGSEEAARHGVRCLVKPSDPQTIRSTLSEMLNL